MQKDPAKRPESLTEILEELLSREMTTKTSVATKVSDPYTPGPYGLNVTTSSPSSDTSITSSTSEATDTVMKQQAASVAVVEEENTESKPLINEESVCSPEYDPDPAASLHVDSTIKQYKPEPVEKQVIEPLLSDMIEVDGGTFFRGSVDGSRDEMPRHRVELPSFSIDIHPITNEQFIRFLEAMGGEKDHNNNWLINLKESRILRRAGKISIETGYTKHPVVGVTWYGAAEYAKWIGKRLPTEAEWETAACSADETHVYPSGENIEKTQANFFSSDTTAVMSYAPNDLGLYDVSGNVYEWCQDWYGYNYYEESELDPHDPAGPLQGVYRVLRGGCWKSLKEDLRCAHRHRNNPGTVNRTYGFRCAVDI